MADEHEGAGEKVKEKVKEILESVVDALESLLAPPPQLVPVRPAGRRRRRR